MMIGDIGKPAGSETPAAGGSLQLGDGHTTSYNTTAASDFRGGVSSLGNVLANQKPAAGGREHSLPIKLGGGSRSTPRTEHQAAYQGAGVSSLGNVLANQKPAAGGREHSLPIKLGGGSRSTPRTEH